MGEKVYALRDSTAVEGAWARGQLVIKAPATGGDVLFRRGTWEGIAIVYQGKREDAAWRPGG